MNKGKRLFISKTGLSEAAIWFVALVFLAVSTPIIDQHFTLCAFHWLGFESCPGCGIGRSISFFLHGDFMQSWQMHYLGIPATLFLIYRISSILYRNIKTQTL